MDTTPLSDAIANYTDGLITGFELANKVDAWRASLDMTALEAAHNEAFEDEQGFIVEPAV